MNVQTAPATKLFHLPKRLMNGGTWESAAVEQKLGVTRTGTEDSVQGTFQVSAPAGWSIIDSTVSPSWQKILVDETGTPRAKLFYRPLGGCQMLIED